MEEERELEEEMEVERELEEKEMEEKEMDWVMAERPLKVVQVEKPLIFPIKITKQQMLLLIYLICIIPFEEKTYN